MITQLLQYSYFSILMRVLLVVIIYFLITTDYNTTTYFLSPEIRLQIVINSN